LYDFKYREELKRRRKDPEYRFRLYDSYFCKEHGNQLEKFLLLGRDMLMSVCGITEERIMLAKVNKGATSVVLYVDRDYYELLLRDSCGNRPLCIWQFARACRGMTLEDLEWIMSDYLYGDTVSALERKETPFSFLLKRRKGISVQEIKKEEDLEIDDLV